MRLPGRRDGCGPLLELGWIGRHLGPAISEGEGTIAVDRIIGTVHRGRDFDGCWRPTEPRLSRRLDEIHAADPAGLDEPIDVVRVDRAYFVVDGHKRVALANRTGREFLDARVSHVSTPYELTPDAATDAILRTAREGEFRRHSGIGAAVPRARFALTDMDAYGELHAAVQSFAYGLAEQDGRLPDRAEAAGAWYRDEYLPSVGQARARIGDLLRTSTDADVYLLWHRQRLAFWGTDCDAPECAQDELLKRRRLAERGRGTVGRLRPRPGPRREDELLLPLSESSGEG